jgi:hypothetical protein
MKAKDVDFFEKVVGQLHQLHNEISVLSKSKPDNPINKFKLGFINEKLTEANKILTGEFKPFRTSPCSIQTSFQQTAMSSWCCRSISTALKRGAQLTFGIFRGKGIAGKPTIIPISRPIHQAAIVRCKFNDDSRNQRVRSS